MKFGAYVKTVFVIVVLLFVSGCEEDTNTEPDTTTEIEIISPADGSVLGEVRKISLSILNDDDLSYVQIIIDGQEAARLVKGVLDWDFNPVFYNDGEMHTLLAVATETDGDQSQSGVVSFEVDDTAVLSPVYIKPAGNYIYAEAEEVIVDWEKIINAVEYTVQLSDDKEFFTILSEDTVSADSAYFGAHANGAYYFRIKAENTTGKTTGWANTKKLYVGVADITWMNTYDFTPGAEWANDVIILPDNNIIAAGPSWDYAMESAKISVVYTDMTGSVIWNKMLGEENKISYGNEVIKIGDYIYIAGGQASDIWASEMNMLLIKLDLNGNVIWSKKYGDYESWIYNAVAGTDGFIYLKCDYNGMNSIVKIDADGNLEYSYSTAEAEWLRFNFNHLNEMVIMYGSYGSLPHIVSLDADGQVVSDLTFGSTSIDYAEKILADASGIYILDEDYVIKKFSYEGNVLYQYQETSYEFTTMILSGGALYASGYDYYGNAIMKKFSSTLTVDATHLYCTGMLTNLCVSDDGSSLLCGTDTAEIDSSSNMLLIRTDKDGNCDGKLSSAKTGTGTKLKVKYDRLR
ncbi:TPA: hypothetical protein DCR49_06015 [Candidatus Delongbacteria bacterium]|nr:hypothetical protein [Candidatus Delongbacteria bacterium]